MTPTIHNTHRLHEHLRSAVAQLALVVDDLDGPNVRAGFDMGVGRAADVLDAIGREVGAAMREAESFASVNADGAGAWPEVVPERMLFAPMEPVPVMPAEAIALVGERIRGVLTVTAAALRQGDVYVYPNDVHSALEAAGGMFAELVAILGKVKLDETPFEGTVYQPNMGPSRTWPGASAA